jgi:hypothetical protein
VKLTLGKKLIRIGTDDDEELAKFVGEKTGLGVLPNSRATDTLG